MTDKINPEHYKIGGIENIDYIKAKLTPEEYLGYLKGTQMKYRARIGYKEGEDAISDIDKMDWYRNKEKEIYVAEQQDIKTKVMLQMQEQELHDED
tara:strand:- start:2337 stop:2624 length:288 start_codon:yes stop_codon:yes gene_type:complete